MCLLYQNVANRRTIQMGVVDRILKRAELGGSVILFDDVNH